MSSNQRNQIEHLPVIWIALFSDRYSTLELTSMSETIIKDRLHDLDDLLR